MNPVVGFASWNVPWPVTASLLEAWGQSLALAGYVLAQATVVLYSSHRWLVLWRRFRAPRAVHQAVPAEPGSWPVVTVQLPVFNERRVVQRLIDSVAALDYPRDRLEIQVLDDSTDETRELAAAAVARHRAAGIDIVHLMRDTRAGYKAGALADGLAHARGGLVAVFDADFVPRADFLRRMVPHFADPRVGMAQARWIHLDRDASWLTRAQAVMLDAHFLLEHATRQSAGLFFNFNGTAGVWRRACIESSGGWQHDTLTEDLDLSYRAQLAGWRFVFDPTVEVPAELPGGIDALFTQQRRWVKGSIQTARKLLPDLLRRGLSRAVRIEAVAHLTGNLAYPMLLAMSLLLLPVLLGRSVLSPVAAWALELSVIVLGALPVALFLWVGQRAARRPARRALQDVLAALALGVGLSLNNARATLAGLSGRVGDWERTPKRGDTTITRGIASYPVARVAGRAELALACYFALLAVFVCARRDWHALPFVALLAGGFTGAGWSREGGGPARIGNRSQSPAPRALREAARAALTAE